MRRLLTLSTLGCLGASLTLPSTAVSQDVRYTTVTQGQFGGALGRIMKVVGGSGKSTEVTSIKDLRIRTDDEDKTSTIIDLDAKRLTWLDHPSKTYYSASLAEMAQMAQQMAQQMNDTLEAARQEAAAHSNEQQPEVEYQVRFATDRTGKRTKLVGYDAEQVFLILEIEAEQVAPPEDAPEDEYDRGGTLVFLTEIWLSPTFPAWRAMKQHEKAFAESFGGEQPGEGMQQAFTFDPRIKEGIERIAQETKDLEGTALRTVTHVVTVPHGMPFDRNAVLKDADRNLGDDMAGAAGQAAKESARGAIGGITGGLFGKKKKQEPEEPQPTQVTFMRVISEVTDVNTSPLSDAVFAVPAGYQQRETMWPTMPAQ